MKKIFIIASMLIAFSINKATARTIKLSDTLVYLQTIVSNKQQFIGHPFSKLLDSLQIQIKYFSPTSGLPYDILKETSTHFGFYFPNSPDEMHLTYPHLIIYWQTPLNANQSRQFYNNSTGWTSTVSAFYANGIISDIKILE